MNNLSKIAVVALFLFGVTLMAQPFGMGHMKNFDGMGFWKARIVKALNLTDKQQKEFLKLKTKTQTKIVDLRAKIQKNNLKLKELYAANNLDEAAIKKLISQNSNIQQEIKSLMVDNWFKMYNLLDKNQRQIFKKATGKMIVAMRARMMNAFAPGKKGNFRKHRPCWQTN